MTFASAIFLSGLVAVALPVAIHLLARQRTRRLPWGAMDFLRQSVSSASSRRQRLRDLLLLLLRVLAIACVVLAFAQPFVSHRLLGGQDLETVFIWDISLSTTRLTEKGEPLQTAMKSRLLEELNRLPDRSSVRILLAGVESRWLKPNALTLSPTNRNALQRAIHDQPAQAGESYLANAILRTLSLQEDANASSSHRDIAILHDAQRAAWQTEDAEHWAAIRRRMKEDRSQALLVLQLDAHPALNLPQVGVTNLAVNRDTVAPETPVRLLATVRNYSQEWNAKGDVVWYVDGREVERSGAVFLARNAELKLEQVVRFESEGCHQVECVFETERDMLPTDNRATCVVSARNALPVLIIDDTQRTEPGQIRPSEFLLAALGHSLLEEEKDGRRDEGPLRHGAASPFTPTIIRGSELNEDKLDGQLAVFIAAADHLPDAAIPGLKRFVQQGGGLWLMLNAQQQALSDWQAALLTQLGLEPLSDTKQTVAPEVKRPFTLQAADPKSAFAVGMVAQSLDLYRAEVQAVQELNHPVFLPEERLLETPEGIPILLSLPVGTGRLLLQTTDLGRSNTNLPILQSFVPFVREVAWKTAGSSLPVRNLNQGVPLRMSMASATAFLAPPTLMLPDGTTQEMRQQYGMYENLETLQPGIYKLYDSIDGEPETADETFSVKRPEVESKLDRLSPEELAALVEPAESDLEMAEVMPLGKSPLAFRLALLAALFFLAEALLAHWGGLRKAQRTSRLDLQPVF